MTRRQAINLLEFQKRFPDDKACLDHLSRLRWPNGFRCPRCGNQKCSFIKTRRLSQCSACRYQASVTAGTVFHKTRTSLHKWFWMIFMMTRQKSGVSILRMQALLGIGAYKTAWLMGHKIRKGMEDRDLDRKFAGLLDMEVTLLAPRTKNKPTGQAKDETKSVVSVGSGDDGRRFCAIRLTENQGVESKRSPDQRELSNQSDARSQDMAVAAYPKHQVSHPTRAKGGSRRAAFAGFEWIYAIIANLRGNIRGVHHGVSRKHLQRYISEFCYRFNRRWWDAELFNRAVVACLSASTVTWTDVTL